MNYTAFSATSLLAGAAERTQPTNNSYNHTGGFTASSFHPQPGAQSNRVSANGGINNGNHLSSL